MEERNTIFTAKPGSFAKSIRAYMEYKKTWRMRMEEKLLRMEEEIKRAKADAIY